MAKAKNDGYSLLVTADSAQVINPALYTKTGFDVEVTPTTKVMSFRRHVLQSRRSKVSPDSFKTIQCHAAHILTTR